MLGISDQHDVTLERKGLNRVLCTFYQMRQPWKFSLCANFLPSTLTYFILFNNGDDVERKFRTLELYLF